VVSSHPAGKHQSRGTPVSAGLYSDPEPLLIRWQVGLADCWWLTLLPVRAAWLPTETAFET
jgi:hypothetical protein